MDYEPVAAFYMTQREWVEPQMFDSAASKAYDDVRPRADAELDKSTRQPTHN